MEEESEKDLKHMGNNLILGKNKAWKNGKELVTDCYTLFPDLTQYEDSWRVKGWRLLSKFTCFTVGMGAKFVLTGMNTSVVHGKHNLEAAFRRPEGVPLLSVTNHTSCFDDPGVWGPVLTRQQFADQVSMRWSVSAADISFTNPFIAKFCAIGKVAPIVRGWGVYQQSMDFLLSRLNQGGWVNLFPEGRVNMEHTYIRFKWGVGRLVNDAKVLPIVIPVVHVGMDSVLPNPTGPRAGQSQTMLLRPGNLVTINIGSPIQLDKLMERLNRAQASAEERRKAITDEIERVMLDLQRDTEIKHKINMGERFKRWHQRRDHLFYELCL